MCPSSARSAAEHSEGEAGGDEGLSGECCEKKPQAALFSQPRSSRSFAGTPRSTSLTYSRTVSSEPPKSSRYHRSCPGSVARRHRGSTRRCSARWCAQFTWSCAATASGR